MFNPFRRKKQQGGADVPVSSAEMSGGEVRKARSVAVLQNRSVLVNPWLPILGEDSDFRVRAADEILRRARARLVYFMRSQFAMDNVPLAEYRAAMDEMKAWGDLSPEEREVVEAGTLSPQQMADSSWAIEACVPLVWAIGLLPELSWPDGKCDARSVVDTIRRARLSGGGDGEEVEARPLGEVLDQTDLYYRLHWACRQLVQLERKGPPPGVDPSVVIERRRALEWMVGAEEWDEVGMGT